MIFYLFTNGTLINNAILRQFKEQGHVIPILSMEGHEKITDLRRGAGVYDRLMKDMAKLHERDIFFGTSFTITQSSYKTVTDEIFVCNMRKHGCKAFIYVEYNPVMKGTENWVVTNEQRNELLTKIAACRASQPGVYIAFLGDEKAFGGCLSSGRGFIHISASGDVETCPFAPYSESSILDMPLKEALNSKLFKALRENHDKLMESNGGCALLKKPEWVKLLLD